MKSLKESQSFQNLRIHKKPNSAWDLLEFAKGKEIVKYSLSGINLAVKRSPGAIKDFGNAMAYEAMQLSYVMSSSKGRDKICALIQYIVKLYVYCMRYSKEYHDLVEMGEIRSVIVSKRVVDNISSGRKVFKFLKSIDEVKTIMELTRKKTSSNEFIIKVLSLFARGCGFFYYLLDNVVWFANMGMISKIIFKEVKWTRAKDVFTLAKNWSEVLKSVLVWFKSVQKEKTILEELKQHDHQVVGLDEETGKLVRKLIRSRQKRRNCAVTMIQNALRILMLSYRLNLPVKKYLHPIFVTCCGIVSNIVAIFKIWSNSGSDHKKLIRIRDMKRKANMLKCNYGSATESQQYGELVPAPQPLENYEINHAQYALTQKLKRLSRGNFFKLREPFDDSVSRENSQERFADEPYPFIEQKPVVPQAINLKKINKKKQEKNSSDESDELYDKNVTKEKNYKLFTLRENSIIDFANLEERMATGMI